MMSERTVQVVIENDPGLRETLDEFTAIRNDISTACFNRGKPLKALSLHKKTYRKVKGRINAQLTCTAIRLTAASYLSAGSNHHKIETPFKFKTPFALFLIGERGRDADFRKDGTLSIWTVEGRKHLNYHVPDYFRPAFDNAISIDSMVVKERNGKLIGYVSIKTEINEVKGIRPVGVDLNETNIIVSVDNRNRKLFVSGIKRRTLNKRTHKTIKRLQRKLAQRKAEGKNTKSIIRVLKRLQGKQARRTKDFCHTASKQFVKWCPKNCVAVFEKMKWGQGKRGSRAWNRRFHGWPRAMLLNFISYKIEGRGIIEFVRPDGTSKTCSRCGLPGVRNRHVFKCPNCGFKGHADTNAAVNIRNRFTVFRDGGVQSITPEVSSGGKPPNLLGGS